MTESQSPKTITEAKIDSGVTDSISQLEKRVTFVEKESDRILKSVRKESDRTFNLTMVMVSIVVAGFVLIISDYFWRNTERYEKLLGEVKQSTANFEKNEKVLNCFKNKGYFSIKCYEN